MNLSRKKRADVLLVEQGLAPTRAKAQALIMVGDVFAGDERIEKAGRLLHPGVELRVREQQRFVSRGGLKLEGALDDLDVSVEGLTAADVGASTGGFTDCLLQRGTRRVFAIDVGHGQLAQKLRHDERVVVLERTNARHLTLEQVEGGVELVVVDASFISLGKLLPALSAILHPGGSLVALIKPQFEVGKDEADRTQGVIRDEHVRQQAIDRVLIAVREAGFEVLADCRCRVAGPKGNVEHFVHAKKTSGHL